MVARRAAGDPPMRRERREGADRRDRPAGRARALDRARASSSERLCLAPRAPAQGFDVDRLGRTIPMARSTPFPPGATSSTCSRSGGSAPISTVPRRRAPAGRAADLQHRVRPPVEPARPDRVDHAREAGRSSSTRRRSSPTAIRACASYAQYLLYDDPPRPGPRDVAWAGFQTGLRFGQGAAEARLERLPAADRRPCPQGGASRSGAACDPAAAARRHSWSAARRQLADAGSRSARTRRDTSRRGARSWGPIASGGGAWA